MAAPVNLKERIAALQQRSVSPNTHQSAQALPRGLPSPGSGGLRDKIAKFESKGGMPVPRGSFAMGAPQLAENALPRKRGELYGNRVPALGRPVHPPPTSTDASVPGPRKRCISTGTGLSSSSSNFSTDEPVPPLPNGLSARRNSLAVNFGPGRPAVESPVPEKPPEDDEQPKDTAEPLSEGTKQTLVETSEQSPEDTPAEEQLPKDILEPAEKSPKNMSPLSQEFSKDALSDCHSAPQSAVSQPISSPPSPPPAETFAVATPTPAPAPAETPVVSPPNSPPKQVTKPAAISVPNTIVPIPPSIPTPTPMTQSPPQSKSTFKAVVHRKVTEQPTPAPSSLAPPPTPQTIKHRRSANTGVIEMPPSPGGGDLAVLLGDAALLEWRLTEGDGLKAKEPVPNTPTPTSTTFQTDPRHQSASTLIEHAHIPSIDSGSQSERSMSIPSIREPFIDGEIPEGEETDGRSLASTTFSQRSPSHRKYLSNIYRLTSRRSSGYMGGYPRDSMSVSSEDSSPVTTPSDNGKRKGFGIGWPSASPKKGGPIVSRSSSFADKIFSRNRTKSNVSTSDQERSSLYGSSQRSLAIKPSLTISFPSELSPDVQPVGVDIARQTSWISPGDSNSEFSPASSILDKDIFDAFPSVPQTLPPGFHLDAENPDKGRASTLPHARKQTHPRLSMV